MKNITDFDEITCNIRKAFRLLFNFVKTFHGIINYIKKNFNLIYEGDKEIAGVLPQKGSKNIQNKELWDWLPIYYYEYVFKKNKPQFSFSVILQCDTGFFDYYSSSQKNWENWEPSNDKISDKPDEYIDVEKAKTRIIFGICEDLKTDIGNIFHEEGMYGDNDFKEYFNFCTKKEFEMTAKKNIKVYFKVFELADFKDEVTARQSLRNYVEYLKRKGINYFELIKDED